jgi:hypothetical protein
MPYFVCYFYHDLDTPRHVAFVLYGARFCRKVEIRRAYLDRQFGGDMINEWEENLLKPQGMSRRKVIRLTGAFATP